MVATRGREVSTASTPTTRRITGRPYPGNRGAAPCPPGCPLEFRPVSDALPPLLIADVEKRVEAELDRVAPVVDELGARFAAAGHDLALVGGPVRDAMLGRMHNDLDLTTSARPHETERLLKGWADAIWDMGRAFGTIGCRKGEWQIEITTYRSDRYDPSSRKPDVAFGDSIEVDLGRRDFTVNAMAVSVSVPGRGSSSILSEVWSTSPSGCYGRRARRTTRSPTIHFE